MRTTLPQSFISFIFPLLDQAEDRAHRIGQTSTVKVTYFLAKGSVDELLWPLVRLKMKLLGELRSFLLSPLKIFIFMCC